MARQETKKEQIFDAALVLFSKKGYDGVGVDEIAESVGIKGPTLYYYFKGKDMLLEQMIDYFSEYYLTRFVNGAQMNNLPESLEEFVEVSYKRLEFTIHDKQIKMIRKFLTMEQYRNDKLRDFATQYQIVAVETLNIGIFEHLVKINAVKKYDPKILAFEFSFPITIMIQLIDRDPEKEEYAMGRIKEHMNHFIEVYGV